MTLVRLILAAPWSRVKHSTTEPLCSPKLDLVNMKAYIKFGENMSSSSQDIERKRNLEVNQGP